MPVSETPLKGVDELVKLYGDRQAGEESSRGAEQAASSTDTATNLAITLRTSEGATATTSTSPSTLSGEEFLRDYYSTLSSNLDELEDFYHEDAVMTLQYDKEEEETGGSLLPPVGSEEDSGGGDGGVGAPGPFLPLSPIGKEIRR